MEVQLIWAEKTTVWGSEEAAPESRGEQPEAPELREGREWAGAQALSGREDRESDIY